MSILVGKSDKEVVEYSQEEELKHRELTLMLYTHIGDAYGGVAAAR